MRVGDGDWTPTNKDGEIVIPLGQSRLSVYVAGPKPSGPNSPLYQEEQFEIPSSVVEHRLYLKAAQLTPRLTVPAQIPFAPCCQFSPWEPTCGVARSCPRYLSYNCFPCYPGCHRYPFCCGGGAAVRRHFAVPGCVSGIVIDGAHDSLGDASLLVSVPDDAVVIINGQQTHSAGTRRVYTSDGLARGYSYPYVVIANVVRDGKVVEQTRELFLHVGESKAVTIDFPGGNSTAAPAR